MMATSDPSAPTSRRFRVEVTDRYGTVAEIIDPDAAQAKLRPKQREQLAALADDLLSNLVTALGCDEDHARHIAVAALLRHVADERAYERVADRRGLLPL